MSEHDVIDPDTGKPRLLTEKCTTCVFRPSNLMHLSPGRLKELTDHHRQAGAGLTCHQTLSYSETGADRAFCRGFHDAYPGTQVFQIAERLLGGFTSVPPPK
ncbi:hypothetical protein ACWFMI_24785 [Nocardiopsis terrae]|uniref:hypothetical protein n=1 Tax=Streptomyces sp. NPDC057554 TaxID=3350538 RepID=UPI0036BCE8B5